MSEARIAPSLAEAQIGDRVWFYDSQRSRYGPPPEREYQGRGVWELWTIMSVNRASFLVAPDYLKDQADRWRKFAKEDGLQRGGGVYGRHDSIFGQKERDDFRWRDAGARMHSLLLSADLEKVKAVAAILGYEPPERE